jgi:predicted DsbA family dithiol-disulfide isomerase
MPMKLELWSDLVCPWCYIGKRRLEAALARFEHRDEITLALRSFELDPNAPPRVEGSLAQLLADKYGGSLADAQARQAQITELAAEDGLEYHFERAQHGNTFDAHRLLHLAAERDVEDAVAERLLTGYFRDGLAIGDSAALAGAVAEAGLAREEAEAVLSGDRYADAVRLDEQRATALGIRGVPFLVIDERFGVSGAQSADVFLQVLEQAWGERAAA